MFMRVNLKCAQVRPPPNRSDDSTVRGARCLANVPTPFCHIDSATMAMRLSCRMPTRTEERSRITLLQGTLDLLILRTLLFGPQHGQGIARAIQEQSGDTLLVDHGSLYPALQRLEEREWIRAEWGTSDNNRKARFYKLTKAGRTQLVAETDQWRRLATAIGRVLGPSEG